MVTKKSTLWLFHDYWSPKRTGYSGLRGDWRNSTFRCSWIYTKQKYYQRKIESKYTHKVRTTAEKKWSIYPSVLGSDNTMTNILIPEDEAHISSTFFLMRPTQSIKSNVGKNIETSMNAEDPGDAVEIEDFLQLKPVFPFLSFCHLHFFSHWPE